MVLRYYLDINSVLYDNIIYDISNIYLEDYKLLCNLNDLLHNSLYKLYKYNSILSKDILIKNKINLNKEHMSIVNTYTLFKLNSFYAFLDEIKNKMCAHTEIFKGKIFYKKDIGVQFFNRKVSASSVLSFYFGGSYGNNLIISKGINMSNFFYVFKDTYLSSFLNFKKPLNFKLYFNYLNVNYIGYEYIKNFVLVLNRLERENSYIFLIKNFIERHSYLSNYYFGENLLNLLLIKTQYNTCNILFLWNKNNIYINSILELDITMCNNTIKKPYNIQYLFSGLLQKQTEKIEGTDILLSIENNINIQNKNNYVNFLSENYLFINLNFINKFVKNIDICINSKNLNILNFSIKNNYIYI